MVRRRRMAARVCAVLAAVLTALPGATVAAAQTSGRRASGRVVMGRDAQPIAGAVVAFAGHAVSVLTDAGGAFDWPAGVSTPVTVIVVLADGRVGRPLLISTLDPGGGPVLRFEPIASESVTVTGVAPAIEVSPGATATVIPRRDLELRRPVTLARALETVPGVGFVSEGQAATPAVRGLARGRTLLLVDGSRVTSERRAGPNASFLDPGTARTIDVARGPGSVAYGSDAFGGVVAVETRRADPATPLAVMFAATAAEGAPERRGEFEITAGYGSGGVLLAVRDRRFRNYDAPMERVANSAWADAGARLRWDHDDGNTRWSAGWQRDAGRDIGRPRSDSGNMLAVTPIESSHRLNATYARRRLGGFTNVRVDVLAARSRDRTEQIRTPSRLTPRRVTRADIRASDVQVRATTDRAAGNARLTIGGDVLARHGVHATDSTLAFDLADRQTSITTTVSIDSARRVQTGAFVQADVPLGSRFSAVAGVRADSVRSTAAGAHFGGVSVEHAAVSGLVAAIVRPFPTDTAITVQLARGFRDPTLSDRFHRGPVGRGVIEGNPDLAPETSRQFDLAVRHAAAPVTMTAAYYDYRIHDLIERYAATPDLFRFRNRGRARIRGLEVQAQVDLGQGVALDAAAHRSRGRDADDDTPLDDIAPDAVSVGLRYAAEGMAATSLRFARIAAHDEAGPSEVATPGYTLVEAGLAVTVRRGLEARFTVRNLLDAPYHSDAGPRWVSAPGRHGSLTLVLTWPSAR